MSKQVYIDSNGNEVQVSGTVNSADMLPIEAGSSKMTSEAIGDLSQLTTSVNSSLVGAVNEVNNDLVFKQVAVNAPMANLASGASIALTANDFNYTIPTGYTPICIYGYTMFGNANGCFIYEQTLTAQGAETMVRICNSGSSATSASGRCYLGILLVKTSRVQ